MHAPTSRKKKKPSPFRRYFKCRVKVPVDEPTVDDYGDGEEGGRFVNDTWAPNCMGPEGVRDEVEVCPW